MTTTGQQSRPIPGRHLTDLAPGDPCPRCRHPLEHRTPRRRRGQVIWFLQCVNAGCRTTTVLTRRGLAAAGQAAPVS